MSKRLVENLKEKIWLKRSKYLSTSEEENEDVSNFTLHLSDSSETETEKNDEGAASDTYSKIQKKSSIKASEKKKTFRLLDLQQIQVLKMNRRLDHHIKFTKKEKRKKTQIFSTLQSKIKINCNSQPITLKIHRQMQKTIYWQMQTKKFNKLEMEIQR